MTDLTTTRLGFIRSSAAAAAGLTAVGAVAAPQADAEDRAVGSEPVVAYVKDPRTGEISVMAGDREVVAHDHQLAAKLERAAG